MRAGPIFPEHTERLEAGGMAIGGSAVAACLANARAAAGVAGALSAPQAIDSFGPLEIRDAAPRVSPRAAIARSRCNSMSKEPS